MNMLRGGRENSDIPPPSINERVQKVASGIRLSTVKPTQTQLDQYEIASTDLAPVLVRLKALIDGELPKFEKVLEDAGAPQILIRGPLPSPANVQIDEFDGDREGMFLW